MKHKEKIVPILTRVFAWALLIGAVYLLRSFFLLIFLTFVFAFIQLRAINSLQFRIRRRAVRVWLVGISLLTIVVLTGLFLTSGVRSQTVGFVKNFSAYLTTLDEHLYGLADSYPILSDVVDELRDATPDLPVSNHKGMQKSSPTLSLAQQLLDMQQDENPEEVTTLLRSLVHFSGKVFGVTTAFLLSLLFSFLIVLDLPKLQISFKALERTKLGFIYREFVPGLHDFSQVLGRALEAQFFIAVVNSVLTAIGLYALGLGHSLAFLTTFVFLFSFVPVAGVFISSAPICLVALQSHGVQTMVLAILLITLIHMVEAYILNPRIYGNHMRLNPVIVLVILTIFGKVFHFWGLVLGVPFCTWFFTHAIRHRPTAPDKVVQTKAIP